MTVHYYRRTSFAASAISIVASLVVATSTSSAQTTAMYSTEQLREHFKRSAEAYEIEGDSGEAVLRPQSLMNWKNPVRTQSQGAMYVWFFGGRPYALGSIFTYEWNGRVNCRHELVSLAPEPLVARLDSEVVWSPRKPGLSWTRFETNVTPAGSKPRRLFQMRSLARQFTGTLTTDESVATELSFIPQPLLRYDDGEQNIIDGAIFSLAMGTDPEILLIVEAARAGDKDGGFYRYSAARANYFQLDLKLNGKTIWDAPEILALQQTRGGQHPYCTEPFFPMTPAQKLPPPEDLE